MEKAEKFTLTSVERAKFIDALTPELATLRMKADISQEELAAMLGVTRQTYNAIECKTRRMSWSMYLALIFFYDHNKRTKRLLHTMNIYPYELISIFNNREEKIEEKFSNFFPDDFSDIAKALDDQALRCIKLFIISEYARCANMSDEATIKAFSNFNLKID